MLNVATNLRLHLLAALECVNPAIATFRQTQKSSLNSCTGGSCPCRGLGGGQGSEDVCLESSTGASPPYIGGCELQRRQRAARIPVCAVLRRGTGSPRRTLSGVDLLHLQVRSRDTFPSQRGLSFTPHR
ncbi:hypothetical protein Q5P01_009850 [Channa striata]|uniref:Secreted protein n=1 Tax=Channa striata TaxID=64152 RepID=A0AA88SV38_CHASR|nr:hypothetical protein Q5P01_009850 [Channa striata]